MALSFRMRYVCYNYVGGEFVQEVTSGKLSPGHTVSVWLERMPVDLATGLMSTRIWRYIVRLSTAKKLRPLNFEGKTGQIPFNDSLPAMDCSDVGKPSPTSKWLLSHPLFVGAV